MKLIRKEKQYLGELEALAIANNRSHELTKEYEILWCEQSVMGIDKGGYYIQNVEVRGLILR